MVNEGETALKNAFLLYMAIAYEQSVVLFEFLKKHFSEYENFNSVGELIAQMKERIK